VERHGLHQEAFSIMMVYETHLRGFFFLPLPSWRRLGRKARSQRSVSAFNGPQMDYFFKRK